MKTREELQQLMGALPDHRQRAAGKLLGIEDKGAFILERLILDINGYEPVPAVFTRPKAGDKPYPVVLFNHSHGNIYSIGKTELISGCDYMLQRGYAYDLADAGIAALGIDQMCFEERSGRTDSYMFKKLIWDGYVMWAWMVFDSLRAIDYLCTRQDVDSQRIATVGMSMGSVMAQWVSALDERIKVCVDICCMGNYDELAGENRYEQHGIYYYVPGLHKHFGVSDINALIAPRPHFCIAGEYDTLTPARGLDRDEAALKEVYTELGSPENWMVKRYPVGHLETHEMRVDAMEFIRNHL